MSSLFLGNALFFFLAFSYTVYISQEMFIAGASALNKVVSKSEEDRKLVQSAAGVHFDGVEVWLIAALTLLFAVFPLAFATTLTFLYVPFYLLLFVIIGRSVSIEVIYKLDNKAWVKMMVLVWTVSSILLMFLLGMYMSNIFLGLAMNQDYTGDFMSFFNVTSITGGLFFVMISLVAGAGWLYLTTNKDLYSRAFDFIKKVGIIYSVPVLLLLTFMGFNNTDSSIITGQLFTAYPVLLILPLLTVLGAISLIILSLKKRYKWVFMISIVTMVLFMASGFLGQFPYVLASRIDRGFGITIEDAQVSVKTMTILFVVLSIVYPIIIGYQSWKYVKFSKVRQGLEE